MKVTKKGVRQIKGPKPGSVLFRRQQIERMIEAKVDLALRRLLHCKRRLNPTLRG